MHNEELSSSALLAHSHRFKDANPTDTREKWYKNFTAQKMSNRVTHLQTACSVPGIGEKQKKSKVVRYFAWCTILEHCKHKSLIADDEEEAEEQTAMFIDDTSSSEVPGVTDAPAAKVQRVA